MKNEISLTLIPPVLMTDKIILDIRGALRNEGTAPITFDVTIHLDEETPRHLLHQESLTIAPQSVAGIYFRTPTKDKVGKHQVILTARTEDGVRRALRPIEIVRCRTRSTGLIQGAWAGIYHWSESEGRLWNPEIKKMADDQWRELVRAMHGIGMNIINIQEVFRNEMYCDKHKIEQEGYPGRAYYPSKLFPGRMPIAAKDPLEAIFDEADKLDMHVLPGVGLYAWFDYSAGSLAWHKKVAAELWEMYGHHRSFFGFKISEEGPGCLGGWNNNKEEDDRLKKDVVAFFAEFQPFCRKLAPDKPVMVARNAYYVPRGLDTYPKFLEHLDILCPFVFNRMMPDDLTGEEAARLLQRLCDAAGTHLWMDMEIFFFHPDNALFPRPIEGLIKELRDYSLFETILCYQYPGLMNSPGMSIKPGGADTVKLYTDYQRFHRERLAKLNRP